MLSHSLNPIISSFYSSFQPPENCKFGDLWYDGSTVKCYVNKEWVLIRETCDLVNNNSTHTNCPHCGAPNQISICEYCGSYLGGEGE